MPILALKLTVLLQKIGVVYAKLMHVSKMAFILLRGLSTISYTIIIYLLCKRIGCLVENHRLILLFSKKLLKL